MHLSDETSQKIIHSCKVIQLIIPVLAISCVVFLGIVFSDFVGPICETTDKFLTVTNYQKINQGDIIIICDVGAYGMVLSSNYNLRPKPAEILINKSSTKIITKRQKLNNII